MSKRVLYAGSVHNEAEIEACLDVLRSGPTAFRIGARVTAFEQQVAALFGKAGGIAVNSGSSALYLAVELLDLYPTLAELAAHAFPAADERLLGLLRDTTELWG